MPQKSKLNAEEKVEIIRKYQQGEISLAQAAREARVETATIYRWSTRYEAEGAGGFLSYQENRVYPSELKLKAVQEYLSGSGSLREISKKYKLRNERQLSNWIKVYNAHGDFNSVKFSGGGSYMKQGRDTTQEERVQIVKDCLASGKNYGEMALKVTSRYVPGRCGLRRWARPVWRTGAESGRRIRFPGLSWRRRRSRSNSSSTSCIWQKWSVIC